MKDGYVLALTFYLQQGVERVQIETYTFRVKKKNFFALDSRGIRTITEYMTTALQCIPLPTHVARCTAEMSSPDRGAM